MMDWQGAFMFHTSKTDTTWTQVTRLCCRTSAIDFKSFCDFVKDCQNEKIAEQTMWIHKIYQTMWFAVVVSVSSVIFPQDVLSLLNHTPLVQSSLLSSGLPYFLQDSKAAAEFTRLAKFKQERGGECWKRAFMQIGCGETLWSYNLQPKQTDFVIFMYLFMYFPFRSLSRQHCDIFMKYHAMNGKF